MPNDAPPPGADPLLRLLRRVARCANPAIAAWARRLMRGDAAASDQAGSEAAAGDQAAPPNKRP
jgi:hypothetical protein